MHWTVLIVSAVFEAVWAIALGKSEGFTKLVPVIVFFAGMLVSMGGLAYALRALPVGTAYAVWVGIGATLTVVWSIATGQEGITPLKAVFIAMIIGGIIGLKAVSAH
ncbi:multidrug efflux SMR transporter [Corynebacterium sp.]|uniref:DMT family transporter n=1 Tax=Corynebacterium sp. TaxID=1720 RepID=UPI0026DCC770|nr:SMR family transporter [Corynebacterium sp.]MDO4610938.1 SMR family transporter [Corynebacterium sp.]